MKVAHLQQHLTDLGKLLDASGAGKGVVADLHAIQERLGTFRDMELRKFADFLQAAEEAVRRGEAITLPGKKPTAGKPKPPSAEVDALAREVKDLYDRAASAEVTEERIELALGKLNALKRDELAVVAEGMRIPLKKSEAKGKILKNIRFWITDRRGKSLRAVLGS